MNPGSPVTKTRIKSLSKRRPLSGFTGVGRRPPIAGTDTNQAGFQDVVQPGGGNTAIGFDRKQPREAITV
jgi:hypothetical protein